MCGLVGVLGQITHNDLDVMKDLLWVDAIRGMDNTGVASATYNDPGVINLCKVSGGPDQLFYHKKLDTVMKHGVSFVMGHNRFKTHGDIKYINAHPFAFSNIVGAHNGTLDWQSKQRMDDHHKFDTDSEALFHTMNNHGIETVINSMKGSYALTWYDIEKRTLNFLRNKDRPLFYVIDDANATMYWASEPGMLYLTLNRHNIKFKKAKLLPEDTLVEYQIHDKPGFQFLKPKHTTMKAPEMLPWEYTIGYNGGGANSNLPFVPTRQRTDWEVAADNRAALALANRRFGNNSSSTSIQTGANGVAPGVDDPVDDLYNDVRLEALGNMLKPGSNLPVTIEGNCTPVDDKEVKVSVEIKELRDKGKLRMDRLIIKGGKEKRSVYRLPSGVEIMKNEFDKSMGEGCCICCAVPAWGEPVKFLKEGEFVCSSCMCSPDSTTFESIIDLIKTQL